MCGPTGTRNPMLVFNIRWFTFFRLCQSICWVLELPGAPISCWTVIEVVTHQQAELVVLQQIFHKICFHRRSVSSASWSLPRDKTDKSHRGILHIDPGKNFKTKMRPTLDMIIIDKGSSVEPRFPFRQCHQACIGYTFLSHGIQSGVRETDKKTIFER